MVNRDSHFSFMYIPVHIAVYNKINISGFFHPDDLNSMFLQVLPLIQIATPETENLCCLIGTAVITPQLSFLNKCHNIRTFIRLILNIFGHNSQIDPFAGQFRMFSVIQLLCIPVKIQKHHAGLCIAHSVKIGHIIIICRLILRSI